VREEQQHNHCNVGEGAKIKGIGCVVAAGRLREFPEPECGAVCRFENAQPDHPLLLRLALARRRHLPLDQRLQKDRFPRSSAYHPDWVLGGVSGGANALWLTEWLTESLDLKPGQRVLDLGCGLASSSIFLRREFGVQVWATDLWFSASVNARRIHDAGVAGGVFPIHADVRSLPFAADYFDAIISIDSYFYYGTDDLCLSEIARFVKPGGVIAVAQAALLQELDDDIPPHLREWWAQDRPVCLHSADWWRRHWARSGIVDVELADHLRDGWQHWRDWLQVVAPQNSVEISALETDQGQNFGYARVIGRRRVGVPLADPVTSVPTEYVAQPLLKDGTRAPNSAG
jgi:cyclopropane fatty-acyl-phospholipid synthase-like methyltransferase